MIGVRQDPSNKVCKDGSWTHFDKGVDAGFGHAANQVHKANWIGDLAGQAFLLVLGFGFIRSGGFTGPNRQARFGKLHVGQELTKWRFAAGYHRRVECGCHRQAFEADFVGGELGFSRLDAFNGTGEDNLARSVVICDDHIVSLQGLEEIFHLAYISDNSGHGTGVLACCSHQLATSTCYTEHVAFSDYASSVQCGDFAETMTSNRFRVDTHGLH